MMRSKESSFLLSYYPGSLQDLPLVSPVAIRLAAIARERPLTNDELAQAFESDIFLSAKVVSVANSIFFNLTHTPCVAIDEALTRVGFDFATAMLKNATRIVEPLAKESAEKLWVHCMSTARIARALSPFAKKVTQSTAAVHWVAMIHDIGFLIEANFEPQHFLDVLESFSARERADDEHCVLAHGLAHYWSLPSWVKELLRKHHHDGDDETHELGPLIALLNIAHSIAQSIEYEIDSGLLSCSGLTDSCVAQIAEQRQRIFEGLIAMQKN